MTGLRHLTLRFSRVAAGAKRRQDRRL